MWDHENVFGLLVQWVCCCAGGERNNQPSMKAAKVMDGRGKKDRTAAGKGWQKGTAAGDESVDNRWVPAVAAKTATMRTIDAGWVTRQPPLCHDACVLASGTSSDDPCQLPAEDLLGVVVRCRCHADWTPEMSSRSQPPTSPSYSLSCLLQMIPRRRGRASSYHCAAVELAALMPLPL